jgi:hypothetical protein
MGSTSDACSASSVEVASRALRVLGELRTWSTADPAALVFVLPMVAARGDPWAPACWRSKFRRRGRIRAPTPLGKIRVEGTVAEHAAESRSVCPLWWCCSRRRNPRVGQEKGGRAGKRRHPQSPYPRAASPSQFQRAVRTAPRTGQAERVAA